MIQTENKQFKIKVTQNESNASVKITDMTDYPGAITPIYVRWLWLDRILCKIFNPFKKL